jgi:tRNA uridine 5-carbamoylmethylation protein Kti12
MAEYRDLVVLFEGAPLFNISFLTYCKVKIASTVPSTLVYALETSEATLDYRRQQRGDKQTRRCLREQAAKIKAILKDFPHAVRLRSESLEDLEKNVEVLREAIFK